MWPVGPLIFWLASVLVLATESALEIREVRTTQPVPPATGNGYAVTQLVVEAGTEFRCYCHGHHFLSALLTGNSAFALRPHPGVDRNGWGSTWYLQPFLPGATLGHTATPSLLAGSGGISLVVSGLVSKGAVDTYGVWNANLNFGYIPTSKTITGQGAYAIALSGPLGMSTGDLNLYKIASNVLSNVPLVDGTVGDTGDMTLAFIQRHDGSTSTWYPIQNPGYFPGDTAYSLSVSVTGAYNQVDTAAQGFCPIQTAYKPTMKVALTTAQTDILMIFGGIYTTTGGAAQDFKADNIGITPLVLNTSPYTNYSFNVTFESVPRPGDGLGVDVDLTGTLAITNASAEVLYTADMLQPFRRTVGFIPRMATNKYAGTVSVPYPPTGGPSPARGFFKARTPCSTQSQSAAPANTKSAPKPKRTR